MEFKQIGGDKLIQFSPDASKSLVTADFAAGVTKTFKKGTGGDYNIQNWLCIRVYAAVAGSYYFNTDTTKTFPLLVGINDIYLADVNIQQVVITMGAGANAVQGM